MGPEQARSKSGEETRLENIGQNEFTEIISSAIEECRSFYQTLSYINNSIEKQDSIDDSLYLSYAEQMSEISVKADELNSKYGIDFGVTTILSLMKHSLNQRDTKLFSKFAHDLLQRVDGARLMGEGMVRTINSVRT